MLSQAEGSNDAEAIAKEHLSVNYHYILICGAVPAKCVTLKINGEKIEDMQA